MGKPRSWYVPPNAEGITTTKELQRGVAFAIVSKEHEQKVMEGVFTSDQQHTPEGWYIEALIRTDQYQKTHQARLYLGIPNLPITEGLNLSDAAFVEQYRVIRLLYPPH